MKTKLDNTTQPQHDAKLPVSSIAYWGGIKTSEAFLIALKENNVTFSKLKLTVFGNTASKVIRAFKKGGQACFDDVVKAHQIWWCTKHAICQVLQEHCC